MMAYKLKVMIVGDSGVGKTSFVANLTNETYFIRHIPTVIDFAAYHTSAYGFNFKLLLQDTTSIPDYNDMRTAFYRHSHIIFLCFSLANPETFENVKNKWWSEIQQFAPDKPVILVGLKEDLKTDRLVQKRLERKRLSFVTTREGRNLAKELGFSSYVEMSAKWKDDARKVVDEALRIFCVPEVEEEPKSVLRRLFGRFWRRD